MRRRNLLSALLFLAVGCGPAPKEPVDYVNPYIGNISHLLVPTFPTVQLPNSMLRVYPERADYTSEYVNGLPVIVTNHRERSAFKLSVTTGETLRPLIPVSYDNEHLTPYGFGIDLEDGAVHADYAVSHQSAAYRIRFRDGRGTLLLTSQNGAVSLADGVFAGYQVLDGETKVYVYMEVQEKPVQEGILRHGQLVDGKSDSGRNACVAMVFNVPEVHVRYGVSFISQEQAAANLHREINTYDVEKVAAEGRKVWNEALGRMEIRGGSEKEKTVFYTSYYRTFERPVCLSEDGRYWSAFDNQVHEDGGTPFYTDDWIWDTYRAAHPLRVVMNPSVEEDILASFIRMAEQTGNDWAPTFPEVTGDSRRMNSNHTVATFADAIVKGLDVDKQRAFEICRKALLEKTLAPWCGNPAGWIDQFFWHNGYIPALRPGEPETDPNVHSFEKRQPVAVTLGTAYDSWCMSVIADAVKQYPEGIAFRNASQFYRNLYNGTTGFFHPKDKDGYFIEPLDYSFSGGMGAREYYGENNAWVYRWDVQQDIPGLITLMGGPEAFVKKLDETFSTPLGRSKYAFYAMLPDHTGNVGQFSMANEPSLHIPYLYDYAGAPWKTQKRIRQLLRTWFRDDLMGVPGDEDGGGMTSFVVWSCLGLYPVTPGSAEYAIGSPVFPEAVVHLPNGKTFEIVAKGASEDNKYIQSATLNGEPLTRPFLSHDDVVKGGKLVFVMGDQPDKNWGI
jgi:predicted alpha-1,2-mannosidase